MLVSENEAVTATQINGKYIIIWDTNISPDMYYA